MKLRNTLILLVLVAGLFAYIKWVDSKKLSTPEIHEMERHPFRQAGLEQEKVKMLTIRNRDAAPVQISQKDGVWTLEAPIKDRAQEFDVKKVLGQLDLLELTKVSDATPSKDQLKAYGLLKPEFTVKVEADKPLEISFGDETTLRGVYYVKIEGHDTVYTAPTSIKESLARKPEDWRRRSLSDLVPDAVKKVDLKTAKGEIEIVRSGKYWSLVKPFKARADNAKVEDMLASVLNAQVQDFLTDAKDLGAFGLTEPRATLTFFPEGTETPVVLEVGATKIEKPEKEEAKKDDKPELPEKALEKHPPKVVYVKMTGREGVVTIPLGIENVIQLQPNDLRDQSVMRIQTASVNRLTIDPAGGEKIVLERVLAKSQTSEEWVRKVPGKPDVEINTAAAAHLLNELASAQVDHFVADMASDLKGFGLDQPAITVTIGDYSASNTAETTAGEHEQARLLIGRADGQTRYAKLSDEPFIFAIPQALVDEIWLHPILWRPLEIRSLKPQEIVALDITRTGQPTLSLVRDAKGWAPVKGDAKVSQSAVDALVDTVAKLRAVRWLGPSVPEDGFDKPNLTIVYTLSDKKAGKLQIGSVLPDHSWHASVDGEKATFLIAAPQFDALNASLTTTAKSTTETPSPGPNPAPSAPAPGTLSPVVVPPAEESPKPAEATKPTEAPAANTKPTDPKAQ